jgi:hypothetical protein
LGENFVPGQNPKGKKNVDKWNYYFLYGVERAGMLYDTKLIGSHDWYTEGALWLLEAQGAEGSWDDSLFDTCFAILFLKRATRPLQDVASIDRFQPSSKQK